VGLADEELHLHLLRGGDKLGGRLAYVHHWRLLI
jgi:hypothetical protein